MIPTLWEEALATFLADGSVAIHEPGSGVRRTPSFPTTVLTVSDKQGCSTSTCVCVASWLCRLPFFPECGRGPSDGFRHLLWSPGGWAMHTAFQRFLWSWDAVPMTPTAESTPLCAERGPRMGLPSSLSPTRGWQGTWRPRQEALGGPGPQRAQPGQVYVADPCPIHAQCSPSKSPRPT